MAVVKAKPEDFVVEELFSIPGLSSNGRYSYAVLRKKEFNTISAVRIVSDKLGVSLKGVGFAGLAGMLLLVGLANIIMNRAQLSEAGLGAQPVAQKSSAAGDPLADIGVAPAAVSSGTEAAKKARR